MRKIILFLMFMFLLSCITPFLMYADIFIPTSMLAFITIAVLSVWIPVKIVGKIIKS